MYKLHKCVYALTLLITIYLTTDSFMFSFFVTLKDNKIYSKPLENHIFIINYLPMLNLKCLLIR